MPMEPILLLRIRGVASMTPQQRRKLVHILYGQIDRIEERHAELTDDYTIRFFSFGTPVREESKWQRLRKWAGI